MKNKYLITNILITVAYALFTLLIVLHHEIWADEAQVWQLAKYLSVPELFKHLVNEGHPSLFYLLVMPFAKSGLSIFSMQILCWLSSVVGIFLLFQFSPFKWWSKLAIILSTGFLYAFPVIARSYSLIPPLIFLSAIFYSKRNDKPILYAIPLFFLVHTHIIMYGFVGILTLLFGYEKFKEKSFSKKNIIAFSTMCLGLLLVAIQLIGTYASNIFIRKPEHNFLFNCIYVFTEFFQNTLNSLSNGIYPLLILFMLILFIFLFITLFKTSKKACLIAFTGIFFQIGIYLTAYASCIYPVRIFCAYIIFIFAFWIIIENDKLEETKKRNINILLTIFFSMSIFNSFTLCLRDYLGEYSSSKSTYEFIRSNIDKNSVIMTDAPFSMVALVVYFDNNYTLKFVPYNKNVKYIIWDNKLINRYSATGWQTFLEKYVKEHNPQDKKVYIIQSSDYFIKIPNSKTIFAAKKAIADYETFVIQEYTDENKNK